MQERRLSFVLVSTLLTLSIGGWILTAALHQTIGKADQTIALVHKSGLYQAIIPSQIKQVQQDNPSLAGLPLDNPQVQKAIENSMDTKKIRQEGDMAIGDLYRWLEGKSNRPSFSINAMPDRQTLATELGDVAYQHAATLSTCHSIADVPTDIATNPLAAKCLPPGVDAEAVRQLVIGEVSTNQALASTDGTISADDIKFSNGKPVLDTFSSAPTWYKPALLLPTIFAVAAAVFMILLLIILRPFRGIKSVGKHLFVVGITLAICSLVIAWAIDWAFKRFVPDSGDANVNAALMKLTSLFDAAYRNNIIRLSAYVIVAGAVLYALGWILVRVFHHRSASGTPFKKKSPVPVASMDSLESAPPTASFTPAGPPALPKATATKKTTHKKKPSTSKKSTAHRTRKKK